MRLPADLAPLAVKERRNTVMFNIERFLFSLQYMWQGMLCIFIVVAVLIGTVYLLNRLGAKNTRKNEKK